MGLKTANIDLEARTFKGGVKSKAGKDRIVPIHSLIYDLVNCRVQEGNEYLFSNNGKKLSTSQYYIIWKEIMDKLNIEKTPPNAATPLNRCLIQQGQTANVLI